MRSRQVLLLALLVSGGGCTQLRGLLPTAAPAGQLADEVTIVRDEWGVPHILAATDAGAAFGLGYAQAEDDLHGLEDAYLHALGRASHWYGSAYLAADLVRRAFEVERLAREEYEREPPDRRAIWDAFAAGLNHYIGTRGARPRLITRYEPWMPFALARDVTAGAVIDGVVLGTSDPAAALRGRIGEWRDSARAQRAMGSWALAVAPAKAGGDGALLLESEVGFLTGGSRPYEALVLSDEGWHVRGRVRFGTPIPLSGHNAHIAWALAPDTADHADAYEVTFDHPSDSLMYRYDGGWRAATEWSDTVLVNGPDGVTAQAIRFLRTHHGPVVAVRGSVALAVRIARHEEGGSLQQLSAMSRAATLDEFRSALDQRAVAAGVMYADVDGSIYYLPSNAMPQRSGTLDRTRPVDGASAQAEWTGYRSIADHGEVLDPAVGWIASVGAPPAIAAAGDSITTAAGWRTLPFDVRVPEAVSGPAIDGVAGEWEQVGGRNAARARRVDGAIDLLRSWDRSADTASAAATLFVLWQERLRLGETPGELAAFRALESAVISLEREWGESAVAWGEVNRHGPLLNDGVTPEGSDSIGMPVGGAPPWARTAFTYRSEPAGGAGRRHGVAGTRWIMAVQMGAAPRARTVVPFGQGAAGSPHGFDQAPLYAAGRLKDAAFTRDAIMAAARRTYRPSDPAVRELP